MAPEHPRTVLAAATVGGAGTQVALRALLDAPAPPGGLAFVPSAFAETARAAGWAVAPDGRVQSLLRELVGRPSTRRWVGFADRLPLLGPARGLLVVQNPHLYGPPTPGWGWRARVKLAVLRRWAHRSARRAERIVCSTASSADSVAQATGVDRASIAVVPIPARDLGVRRPPHAGPIQRILLVGDVYAYKRWPVAVDAAIEVARRTERPLTLVHVGAAIDGRAAADLRAAFARAAAAGITVEAPGRVDHPRAVEELAAADVLVLPSIKETQGLPLVEALSIGVPVVASDIGPFRDLADDVALLVPEEAGADGFATALQQLDDPAVRAERAALGQRRWLPGGAWDLVALLPRD